VIQMRAHTHGLWKYRLTVAMVSVFGTMAADILHIIHSKPRGLKYNRRRRHSPIGYISPIEYECKLTHETA